MRFTEKDDFLGYAIPQTNAVGDKQINIALLGKSDNLDEASVAVICQNYIVGEPIRQFGRIEDVLEKHDVGSAEELDLILEGLAKVHQENANLKNQLADLEAKLAESEKSKESYRLQNEHHHLQLLQFYSRLGVEAFGADIHEKALETLMITKENLAEKDKELAYMTEQAKKFNNEAQKYFEDAYCNDFHKQDKISFCIEQLEKVKEFIGRQLYITTKDCNDLDEAEAKGCNELREETIKEIDNQIKQLNEMM